MQDYLIRAIAPDANVRALACASTHLVEEICRLQGTFPTASAALGRALTGALLLGVQLDPNQRIAMVFAGDGPLQKILVEAESDGSVRGSVKVPEVDIPPLDGKLDVGAALGRNGTLTVTKDLRLRKPYQGVVPLYSGEIAEDIAHYLVESEQIPSAVGLGVFVEPSGQISAAGGFLIQTLPGAQPEIIDVLIKRMQALPPITGLLHEGLTPEDLLELIFQDIKLDILQRTDVAFRCSCSKERIEQALIALGPQAIEDVIEKDEHIDITCEFCRKKYEFKRRDIERLLMEMH